MRLRVFTCRLSFLLVLAGMALGLPQQSWAQLGGAGVVVDAEGVLQMKSYSDPGGQLTRERMAAAKASLDPKVSSYSKLRKISLNRLEDAIRSHNGQLNDEMKNLAGMLRVRYVFFYPETKDIVLAGPAEGWMKDITGRTVGLTTKRPVIQLQDLAVALRAFPPGKKATPLVGCSIDPTQEGLAAMRKFLQQWGSNANPSQTAQIVEGLQTSLGPQTVSINGVSPKTHFAQVLVEADYRMKLIGIGLEQPPVKLVSYVDRASPAQVSRNALERWFFVPDYQCVRVSEDRTAAELVGDGVKLVGEGEVVSGDGHRKATGTQSAASMAYTMSFTKVYSELAARSPVYAELRNLIDLTITAALLQKEDLYSRAGWKPQILGDESKYAVETLSAPRQVPNAVNALWKGARLMTPIGGGVVIDAAQALSDENLLSDNGKLSKTQQEVKLNLAKGQWWWD